MTALYVFLFGMPFVLMAGGGVTLWFGLRAAREIRSHSEPRTVVFKPRDPRIATHDGEQQAAQPRAKAS